MKDRDNTINNAGEDFIHQDLQPNDLKPNDSKPFDSKQQDKKQDQETTSQKANIIEQVIELEQKISDPKYHTFRKSTYWHQLTPPKNAPSHDALLSEIVECLHRIEAKLAAIETMLND
jgi:hypothetical protein